MRNFFFAICLCSSFWACKQPNNNINNESVEEQPIVAELTFEQQIEAAKQNILRQKTDKTFLNSPFKDVYIRDLYAEENGTITIKLPFDYHGIDCSSPDCYTTTISFKVRKNELNNLPKQLPFLIEETSCNDDSIERSEAIFTRKEASKKQLHLHSEQLNSSLAILTDKEIVYYLPNVPSDFTLNDITNFTDSEEEYPFTTSKMTDRYFEQFTH